MTEVNTTSSSPLVGAMGKIKESAMHIFGQVRYDPPTSNNRSAPRGVVSVGQIIPMNFFIPPPD